jgi:teichuronic acid biosynthesis glycosyltransferase TuaG
MPSVSIVTPVYNAARWLPETLASVQAQTFTDWEHLLVDDCSTDNSAPIIEAAARQDPRVRLLRTPYNMGPSRARNLALDAARGRFVALLDADDLWLPEKLQRSLAWLTEHGYDFIYHDYRHISFDGSLIGRLVRGPEELNLRTLHTRRGTGCLTAVLDREKIPDLRFPVVSPMHAEDFCLWSQLVRGGRVGHRMPADLARYRLSPESRSGKKLESAMNAWHVYRGFSKLSFQRAAFWWVQYAWNAFWLHLSARPQ